MCSEPPPQPRGAYVATPRGWWPVAGEAVLRKAVCGRGELPAGIILRLCCRERELPGPGRPQSVRTRAAQRCLCPQGAADGFAWRLRKLYWPCWLAQRSSGGCPGSPPAGGELIYHLPLQVQTVVSEQNCRGSVPCPSPATFSWPFRADVANAWLSRAGGLQPPSGDRPCPP